MTKLYDISPPLGPDTPPFPGDQAYVQTWTATLGPGCPVNLSAVTMSPHVGAHADAPLHYADGAASIDAVDLHAYLGPCRVIHVIGCGPLVRVEHLRHAAQDLPPRVLLRTCERADTAWNPDFSACASETLAWLADQGVRLVGIDTPSVDLQDSKDLPAHKAILRANIAILEGLVLRDLPAGNYELIALPLKLVGFDASPVRAVLRSE